MTMISMFQTWRWKLRAAQQALEQGRLDEAVEKLREDELRQFQPAQPLIEQLAWQLQRRALLRLAKADPQAAWRDLRVAGELVGETPEVIDTRRLLIEGELDAAQQLLNQGQPAAARNLLERLAERRMAGDLVRGWLEVAQRYEASRQLLVRGKFAEAEAEWRAAAAIHPDASFVAARQAVFAADAAAGRQLTDRLQAAVQAGDWGSVRTLADELLQLAPECEWARELRRRAWARLTPRSGCEQRLPRLGATQTWRPSTIRLVDRESVAERATSPRFLLWVDGVGGYLTCLGDDVSLGQAATPGGVDVPILGDLSRRHATVRREGENYLVLPQQPVRVRGQLAREATLLRDGDELSLGPQVRLRFRQPHVLSASARLDWVSPHRSQPSTDGVLLMAESLVLGPDPQNHVVCRGWTDDVVIYRREGRLYCRSAQALEVDGRWCDGEVSLEANSRIVGRSFAISLEPV